MVIKEEELKSSFSFPLSLQEWTKSQVSNVPFFTTHNLKTDKNKHFHGDSESYRIGGGSQTLWVRRVSSVLLRTPTQNRRRHFQHFTD